MSNFPAIFQGFMEKGIAEDAIKPRINVFTYNAWKALGRQVRKGEHGVKVVTFIEHESKELDKDGQPCIERRPWHTTVFHVSQTEAIAPISPCASDELDGTTDNVPYAGESEQQGGAE